MSIEAPRRERIAEFDLLRGIAIIGVVYLHAYFTPWPEASQRGLSLLHFVHLFAHGAVPLFLFIAAFLQAAGPEETPLRHLRHRFRSVWVPVILWTVAAFLYRLATDGNSLALWKDLALFNISGQFYFVWLLLVFGLVLTQGHRVPDRWLPALVAAAFVINLLTIAFYQWHGSITGLYATLAYRNPLVWLFFPALGYALGRHGIARVPARAAAAAILAMALIASVYMVRGVVYERWPASYFGVSIFLFSAAGMFAYPVLAKCLLPVRLVSAPLLALAPYAFPIFLIHVPFAMGFGTKELLGDGARWSNYWVLLHANFAVGLLLSLAFVRVLERISPRLGSSLLGIRRPAFSPRPRLRFRRTPRESA